MLAAAQVLVKAWRVMRRRPMKISLYLERAANELGDRGHRYATGTADSYPP